MKWPSDRVIRVAIDNGVKVISKGVYAYFDKCSTRICATRVGERSYIIESESCGPEIYSEDNMIELVRSL